MYGTLNVTYSMNEPCHSWHFLGQLAGSRGHGATVAWAAFHRHRQLISSGSQKTSTRREPQVGTTMVSAFQTEDAEQGW